jgi:hypothetical protein
MELTSGSPVIFFRGLSVKPMNLFGFAMPYLEVCRQIHDSKGFIRKIFQNKGLGGFWWDPAKATTVNWKRLTTTTYSYIIAL